MEKLEHWTYSNQKVNNPTYEILFDQLKYNNLSGVFATSFSDWNALNHFEEDEGKRLGKPREKITDLNKMLEK